MDIDLTTSLIGLGEIGKPLFNLLSKSGRMIGAYIDSVSIKERAGVMHVCFPFVEQDGFLKITV